MIRDRHPGDWPSLAGAGARRTERVVNMWKPRQRTSPSTRSLSGGSEARTEAREDSQTIVCKNDSERE